MELGKSKVRRMEGQMTLRLFAASWGIAGGSGDSGSPSISVYLATHSPDLSIQYRGQRMSQLQDGPNPISTEIPA